MKKVLILDDGSVGVENYAIRNVLESFGYLVTIYPIGRPQHYFDVFGEKEKLDYDYLIIGCHGDDGKIIVPVLGENIYYPDGCRSNLGFQELQNKVTIHNKTVICTGCTTGSGTLYKAFTTQNNIFIAPSDYIEGKSDLLFVVNMFYHLSNGIGLEDAYSIASKIDIETALYKLYIK